MVFAGMISTAVAQVDTADNVVHSTVQGTEKAARTVAHGVKKAVDTVETPSPRVGTHAAH
jgi:hypothetical protein